MIVSCRRCGAIVTVDQKALDLTGELDMPLAMDCPGEGRDYTDNHLLVLIPHTCGHWQTESPTWHEWCRWTSDPDFAAQAETVCSDCHEAPILARA